MSPVDDGSDPSFVALSARLRHLIDSAFDSVLPSGTQSKLQPITPGGFIVEQSESSQYGAGGFAQDFPKEPSSSRSCIPFPEIPRALKLLDLSPDDDIMGVFKNAATGWGAQSTQNDGVSREDWRAVCAALLGEEHVDGDDADDDIEMGVDSDPDSDEYQVEEPSGDTEEASSDEYEELNMSAKGKKAQKVSSVAPGKRSGTKTPEQLTESQKAQCRQDFSRFFPHVPGNELDHQRIMIKDIARVADLLKESLKTDEILEMLEAFSTSPDKSINLTDFEHMMTLTKLV